MNEKISRYIIIGLSVVLVATLLGSGWLHRRSNRKIAGLELSVRKHLEQIESFGSGIEEITERYYASEAERIDIDRRYRDLEGKVSDFIGGLGDLDGGLQTLESGIEAVRAGLRDDIDSISGVAAEIREIIESAEDLQDGDMEPGGSIGGTVDVPGSGDSL